MRIYKAFSQWNAVRRRCMAQIQRQQKSGFESCYSFISRILIILNHNSNIIQVLQFTMLNLIIQQTVLCQKQLINFINKMAASQKKSSALIQQLCKHIANLEETNAKLHQQIFKIDQEKQIVFKALGKSTWEDLLASVQTGKNRNNQYFQDTSSTLKSAPNNRSKIPVEEPARTPLRQYKYNYESTFESPIESESRLLNKSIRGQTERQDPIRTKENTMHELEASPAYKYSSMGKKNQINPTFLLTLNNLAIHSVSKQSLDLKTSEEENMLLSIQNTRLRQKVAKLQAIVASQQYC